MGKSKKPYVLLLFYPAFVVDDVGGNDEDDDDDGGNVCLLRYVSFCFYYDYTCCIFILFSHHR